MQQWTHLAADDFFVHAEDLPLWRGGGWSGRWREAALGNQEDLPWNMIVVGQTALDQNGRS